MHVIPRLVWRLAVLSVTIGGVVMLDNVATAAPRLQKVDATAAVIADFRKRVDDYMQLHKKLESTLPKLPDHATPQQIDQNQRALGALIAQARAGAKPGDLFTPGMQAFVHSEFGRLFTGPQGHELRRQIHDEPHPIVPEINKRYPDVVPLATMPLGVLASLPKLPDELEYRFVDSHLILMDVHAHLILDYVRDAIPNDHPPAGRQ